MKYNLISAYAKRTAHTGLMVTAYYQQEGEALAKPFKLTVFNGWPRVEIDADVITHHFTTPMAWIDKDGKFERTSKGYLKLTQCVVVFCPKTKEGKYLRGYSPEEQITKLINNKLVPCAYALSEEASNTLEEEWEQMRKQELL